MYNLSINSERSYVKGRQGSSDLDKLARSLIKVRDNAADETNKAMRKAMESSSKNSLCCGRLGFFAC